MKQSNKLMEGLSTFQWLIFFLANSIALPIVIGGAFQLSAPEIASLMQRVFFVVGISSFIQGMVGHRLPLADGPAGSWVSIFVILADISIQQGNVARDALPILESGILIAGLLLVVLGTFKIVHKILFLFTPLVTGTFLLILALQLSGVFLEGMFAVNSKTNTPDYGMAFIAFGVFALIILMSNKAKGFMKSFAVLIGILIGWIIALITGKASLSIESNPNFIEFPKLFAWGLPEFNWGIAITSILFTFLLIANTIAAVTAVKQSLEPGTNHLENSIDRGIFVGGISHFLSGGFSSLAVVPLPVTAGFIQITGQKKKRPFLIAALLLSVLALIPSLVQVLALLPGPIANGALMASFINMIGIALKSLTQAELTERRLTILGITFLISFGLMFLPAGVFDTLPSVLQYIVSNGLLVGTILVILFEQLWKEKKLLEVN